MSTLFAFSFKMWYNNKYRKAEVTFQQEEKMKNTNKTTMIFVLIAMLAIIIPASNCLVAIEESFIAFVVRIVFMASWFFAILAIVNELLPDKYLTRRQK